MVSLRLVGVGGKRKGFITKALKKVSDEFDQNYKQERNMSPTNQKKVDFFATSSTTCHNHIIITTLISVQAILKENKIKFKKNLLVISRLSRDKNRVSRSSGDNKLIKLTLINNSNRARAQERKKIKP